METKHWSNLGKSSNNSPIVYVLGDYIQDVWQNVKVSKIAPDAPVPVWTLDGRPHFAPGGAGNVAYQFRHLAENVTLATTGPKPTGERDDTFGLRILSRDGFRGFNTKTRFVANNHIVARLDDSTDSLKTLFDENGRTKAVMPIVAEVFAELDAVRGGKLNGRAVVVVVADYALGFWTEAVARAAVNGFRARGIPTVLDPKPPGRGGIPLTAWSGVTVVKLNESEACEFTGASSAESATRTICAAMGCPVVTTRSGNPPLVCTDPRFPPDGSGRVYTTSRPLWASGAGDCFTAYLAAGVALSGGTLEPEAVVAAHAAGAVYGEKPYNTPVHPREAFARFDPSGKPKLYTNPAELRSRLAALPPGTRIGYTNGCFDLLHAGHLDTLAFAKSKCDFLVAFLNSDSSILTQKKIHPVLDFEERATALAAVGVVDAVIGFDELTPERAFAAVGRCAVLVKGGEYRDTEPAGREHAEAVAFAPITRGLHSSVIRERVKKLS